MCGSWHYYSKRSDTKKAKKSTRAGGSRQTRRKEIETKWAGVLPAQGPCLSLGFRVAAQGRSHLNYSTDSACFQERAEKNTKNFRKVFGHRPHICYHEKVWLCRKTEFKHNR